MTTIPPHLRQFTTHLFVAVSKAINQNPDTTVRTFISPGNAMPGTGGPTLPMVPDSLTPTESAFLQCGEIRTDYEISIGIVCGMCFIFGIIFNIFGYRCFKAVMFLTGFILASVVIFLICDEESDLSTGANAGIALGIGLLCGLITMLVHFFGLFMTGFCMGLFVTIATLVILQQFYIVSIIWIPIGIAFGCGALGGLLTLKWQREFVIVSTSIIGGATIITSVDYFIEFFRLVQYVYDRFRLQESEVLCWYSWLILAVWPLISLIGMILQFRVTSKGYNHKDVIKRPPKTKKRVELQKIRQRESRAERLAKYQDLYKVRRCNGDVVSASYLQSIQDHLSPELQRIASITHIPPEPDIPAIPAHQNEQMTTLLDHDDYIDEPQSPQTQLPTTNTSSTLTSLDQIQQYTKIPEETSDQIITDV